MTQKHYEIGIATLFCGFLTAVMALNIITPDQSFSPTENRSLAQKPEFTVETVMDGTFMTKFETYVTDQFVGRDWWVSLKTSAERVLGKKENNDVFFASNDTLINRVTAPTENWIEKSAQYFNTLSQKVDVPVYAGIIPTSASIWKDRLPTYATTADEKEMIDQFYALLSDEITPLPLYQNLNTHAKEEIYYRTDHHWTSLGAYYGYQTIVNQMGMTATPLEVYKPTVVSNDFNGTIYSSSGVRWVQPDSITAYVPEDGISVTSNFTGVPEEGALYVPSFLKEKDQYSYFLGGVQALCIIETPNTTAPSILVVRDSYSDSLAPFLTENFSEIHLLDLRYYNAGVAQYVQANEIDTVLVLYSVSSFISDRNFFKLAA